MSRETGVDALQCVRVESAVVVELHLCARPDAGPGRLGGEPAGFDEQARSMYARMAMELHANAMTTRDVVTERVFLTDPAAQVPRLDAIRREIYGGRGAATSAAATLGPAATFIGQSPARAGQLCELKVIALRAAAGSSLSSRTVESLPAEASGRVVECGGTRMVFLAGFTGGSPGDRLGFERQASSMFRRAGAALRRERLSFRDVVRTWINIADIDRDYEAFNRARRAWFRTQLRKAPPASTATGGVPFPADRGCGMDLQAIAGAGCRSIAPFRIPAMNEAWAYGSDFSRGTRVDLADRTVIHVSGTASIDDLGRVVHAGNIEGQADRMLENIEALLGSQGAGYADVVSAVTYLKEASSFDAFTRVAARRGLPARIPNTICVAGICRPEWLCEIEVTAVRLRD